MNVGAPGTDARFSVYGADSVDEDDPVFQVVAANNEVKIGNSVTDTTLMVYGPIATSGSVQVGSNTGTDGYDVNFWGDANASTDGRMFWDSSKSALRAGKADGAQWDDANVGDYSFAGGYRNTSSGAMSATFGQNNTASGDKSFAQGEDNTASGEKSFAQGDDNTTSNLYSAAFGFDNVVSGIAAMTIGGENTASGYQSLAQGAQADATGNQSTAMGWNVESNGKASFAQGYNTIADDDYSVAIGRDARSDGDDSFAIGYIARASGTKAMAIGYKTQASTDTAIVIGTGGAGPLTNTTANSVMIGVDGNSVIHMTDDRTFIDGRVQIGATATPVIVDLFGDLVMHSNIYGVETLEVAGVSAIESMELDNNTAIVSDPVIPNAIMNEAEVLRVNSTGNDMSGVIQSANEGGGDFARFGLFNGSTFTSFWTSSTDTAFMVIGADGVATGSITIVTGEDEHIFVANESGIKLGDTNTELPVMVHGTLDLNDSIIVNVSNINTDGIEVFGNATATGVMRSNSGFNIAGADGANDSVIKCCAWDGSFNCTATGTQTFSGGLLIAEYCP